MGQKIPTFCIFEVLFLSQNLMTFPKIEVGSRYREFRESDGTFPVQKEDLGLENGMSFIFGRTRLLNFIGPNNDLVEVQGKFHFFDEF